MHGGQMPRGRFPVKALGAAMKIAVKRGLVRMYERGPASTGLFTLHTTSIMRIETDSVLSNTSLWAMIY